MFKGDLILQQMSKKDMDQFTVKKNCFKRTSTNMSALY